jgi:hypothetical protein
MGSQAAACKVLGSENLKKFCYLDPDRLAGGCQSHFVLELNA